MMGLGLLALLGAASVRDNTSSFCLFALISAAIHLSLGAFSPLRDYQTFALLPQLLTLPLAVMGLAWLAQQFRAGWVLQAGVIVFALTMLVSLFFTLQPHWDQARFRQSLTESTLLVLDELDSGALQFSPSLFANLPQNAAIQPMGMHWRVKYSKTPIAMAPTTIEEALRFPYPWLGFYQPFDGSKSGILESAQGRLLDTLRDNYEMQQNGNLQLWLRSSGAKTAPGVDALEQYALYGLELPDGRDETPRELLGEPVGFIWDFEHGFPRTRQIGAAFGLEPDVSQSAVGFASAGPGGRGAEWMTGSIESEPFMIEGDELRFFADIPKSSTQTFFALAVQSEEPWGDGAKIQETKHLYDRAPGEVLMGGAFFYVQPAQLAYSDNQVSGWRVVRALQRSDRSGWNEFHWSLGPWAGKQAMWLAADRDPKAALRIDHIQQWKRAPGRLWNFESGTYADWQVEGEAFGNSPATGPLGTQSPAIGFEGNYFINSYHQGSDAAVGRLFTTPFLIEHNQLNFVVGGGDDMQRVYIALEVDGKAALRASGERSEILRRVTWNLSPWMGQSARLVIVDQSSGAWGHILVDDIRMTSVPDP